MLIASVMLAYVAYFSHNAKQHVEGKVDKAISTGNPFFLSLTVFFAIIREGFEVVFILRRFTYFCNLQHSTCDCWCNQWYIGSSICLFWSK
jgi:high-affinity Fe2+/Pb2+ permease